MKRIKTLIMTCVLFSLLATRVSAICPTGIKLLDIVNWQSIFPITIAGIPVSHSTDTVKTIDSTRTPICICPMDMPPFFRVGLTVGFWEPARFIETVKDAWCMPSLGIDLGLASGVQLDGSSSGGEATGTSEHTFAQAHYFVFPIWELLGLLTDYICIEHSGFDVAYMTELDPLWQDDSLAAIIQPEAVLFANPVAQLACIADSISSASGLSLSPLFWCMGSWGSAYPLTGTIGSATNIEANAGIAARMIYKLAREGLVCDTNIDVCGCVPTPIWKKHNYKLHISYPVKDSHAHPIGRTGLLWESFKNPPYKIGQDNFIWMLYRRRNCCAF